MRFEYDKEVDGLYIWLVDDAEKDYFKEIWPKELDDEIGLIFKKDNKLLGFEIMPASKFFDENFLNRL